MMTPAFIFLFDADFYPTGSTTLWLISVGALLGLLAIAALLIVGFVLSWIPGLNRVFDSPLARYIVGAALTIGLLVLSWPLIGNWYSNWQDIEPDTAFRKVSELLLFVVPAMFLFSLSILALCSRKLMSELATTIREGVLFWITIFAVILSVFAVAGYLISSDGFGNVQIVANAQTHVEAMQRWPQTLTVTKTEFPKIPTDNPLGTEVPFEYSAIELKEIIVRSDSLVHISTIPFQEEIEGQIDDELSYIAVSPDEPLTLVGTSLRAAQLKSLYVKNMGETPATLSMTVQIQPAIPQVHVVFYTAFGLVAIYLFYFLMRVLLPKVSAIGLSTFKTEIAQPLFLVLLLVGGVLLFAFVYVPYNTLGEDIKILKDSGLTLILVFSIFMAVWAASKSIAEEIEGRTALTVLSKPVGRRQFIIGKFLGIAWAIGLLFVVLGVWFLACVSYKPIYDAVENSQGDILWTLCFTETIKIVPGLILAYFETLIFVAISVVISTRLPIMANLMICFTIYVLGHLTPLLVQSSVAVDAFEPVVFVGRLIAVILPVLDHFNIQAAVSGGHDVPFAYLGWSAVYCLIYGTIALLLALVLFEDRDLA